MDFLKIVVTGIVASSFSFGAFAASKPAGSGPNPYSDCGIGAAIFENNVAAAISNVIWDLGTTAVTSATASPETCNGKEVEAAAFIIDSYDELMANSADGEGEHFDALMDILAVKPEHRSFVMARVRQELTVNVNAADISTKSNVEKAEDFYNSVMTVVGTVS